MEKMVFELEPKQVEEAIKWIRTHECKLRRSKRTTAIGGKTSYTFVDTTIGRIANVNCACGESHCLTGLDDL
jgi:hypothetical protein